jgi:hypothetical protein
MRSIYIIGALKNWNIPKLSNEIEKLGLEVFSEWMTPGPEADSYLLKYAKERGWSYERALQSYAAKHVFEFDKAHLDRCDMALAVAPFGKSAMLELGYTVGKGKPGYIYFPEEPERFDVMLQFATKIFFDKEKLFAELRLHSHVGKFIDAVKFAQQVCRHRFVECAMMKPISEATNGDPTEVCTLCNFVRNKPNAGRTTFQYETLTAMKPASDPAHHFDENLNLVTERKTDLTDPATQWSLSRNDRHKK